MILQEIKKVRLESPEGFQKPDSYGMFRADGQWLGTVGNSYVFTQPQEIYDLFASGLEKVGLPSSKIRARDIRRGRMAFTIDLPDFTVNTDKKVGDVVRKSLEFITSYDGSVSSIFQFFVERLACTNGMTFQPELMKSFKFRHTENQDKKMREMINGINKSMELEHTIQQEMQRLAEIQYPCTVETVGNFIYDVAGEIEEESKRYEALNDAIFYEVDEVGENGWGLLQGITRYTNHIARTKNRDNYLVFGAGEAMNQRALETIQSYGNRRF